ncbi:metallophosphoesterase family protein [Paenibacillus radicis (ex Xue et al. 2023)]|uniref:Metallophosphoesterase family protein n=1 Tax=Paenibacillus radicis (ex Xue et al. 2023) TaxID=2972489 RepID=A0ABT1YCQ3_9BACL|nr:metallophosphoesterase family protein [Paenibacillus radicis (ex Xue et al. 2023)]MCR8630978.1 metallophosphoesterase family protein [Paenibacillus radicis (ex Xue et al. 2023)]
MKIAFISDIHGNAHALEKVLIDINKKNVDKMYVMGDLCYRGPEPKRSIELIRSLNADVIKGNADEWVVRGVQKGEVADSALEMMNRERDWTVSKLDPTDIDYLSKLPTEINVTIEGLPLHLFHATPDSLFDIVPPDADNETVSSRLMSSKDAQMYIYAHIHKPYIRYINGKVIMNTGSVGLPFDSTAMASYATLEITEGAITTAIERVSFDIEEVVRQYEASSYPNAEMMTRVLRNARVN